ncbi:MAG: AAA family ATPase [Acidimicrobiia bacterium]|nr:AAA family ATPase [Acidimicrobiia bacterium]
MKLKTIEVKNYRSLFADADGQHLKLDLGDGLNAIVGPNNCGKSNVFRALAIALDPDAAFDRSADMPAPFVWSRPTVTLTFQASHHGPEGTLLKRLKEYEQAANPSGKRTYADDGIVKLRVTIESGGEAVGTRRQVFVSYGAGGRALSEDDALTVRALEQFNKCFHFVLIRSGEGLQDLLEGKFRDILENVLKDDLAEALEQAEAHRRRYIEQLREGLLQPLSARITSELVDLFPEVTGIELKPEVAELRESLGNMRVDVTDLVTTDLEQKGTGVRGGMLIAILRHFAETARRSLLFAVEEPESFLHPAAQEDLREDLEALAKRRSVSLLVATHSPYIVSRSAEAKVFALNKDGDGRTVLVNEAVGTQPHGSVIGGLFRDRLVVDVLDRAAAVPATAKGAVVIEGYTDEKFFQLAAERAGRPDLVDDLAFVQAGSGVARAGSGGAVLASMQALIVAATSTLPVVAVFDSDDPGRQAAKFLRQVGEKTNEWNRRTVLEYGKVFGGHFYPYEAEDLWPTELMARFLDEHGGSTAPGPMHKAVAERPDGGLHYDLRAEAKVPFVDFLEDRATAEDTTKWIDMLLLVRKGLGLSSEPPPEPAADSAPDREPIEMHDERVTARHPGTGEHSRVGPARRFLSIGTIPGGVEGWKDGLDRLIAFAGTGAPSRDEAIAWVRSTFPTVNTDRSALEPWECACKFGFVEQYDSAYRLTPAGAEYRGDPSPARLRAALIESTAGIQEILGLLAAGPSEIQDLQELLEGAESAWAQSPTRVTRRLRWLEHAGAVEQVDDLWRLTDQPDPVSQP